MGSVRVRENEVDVIVDGKKVLCERKSDKLGNIFDCH